MLKAELLMVLDRPERRWSGRSGDQHPKCFRQQRRGHLRRHIVHRQHRHHRDRSCARDPRPIGRWWRWHQAAGANAGCDAADQTAGPQSLSASATGPGGAVQISVHGPSVSKRQFAPSPSWRKRQQRRRACFLGSSIVLCRQHRYNRCQQPPAASRSCAGRPPGGGAGNSVGIFAQSATDGRNSAAGFDQHPHQGGCPVTRSPASGAQGAAICSTAARNGILIDSGSSISAASGQAITYSGGYQVRKRVTNNSTRRPAA